MVKSKSTKTNALKIAVIPATASATRWRRGYPRVEVVGAGFDIASGMEALRLSCERQEEAGAMMPEDGLTGCASSMRLPAVGYPAS
jgi:hypothetical protein